MSGYVGADIVGAAELDDVLQQLIAHMDGRPCILIIVVPGIDDAVASHRLDQQPWLGQSHRAEDLLYRLEHLVLLEALIELPVLGIFGRIILNADSTKLLSIGVDHQTLWPARTTPLERQRRAQDVESVAVAIDDGAGPQLATTQVSDRG